jgi:hypothetical protein
VTKRILITFGGRAYDRQIERQGRAVALGIEHRVYDDRWLIGTPFFEKNRWIFERQPQHGFGFCSWKPYIIQHALENFAGPRGVVMYLDADTYPIADIGCLFEMAERHDIVLFEEQGCVNKTWIKRECFERMMVIESAKEAMHACGRFQLFRKDEHKVYPIVTRFLLAWQEFSLNPLCTFHEGSAEGGDDPSFIRNSCEQSVLSLLAHRWGVPLHRTPDQNGWPVAYGGTYKPDDNYPQLFIQDGSRGDVNDLSGSRYRNVD